MNLLGAALYDPAVAVTKATSSLLALTALDTSNLRLAITVPAHGMIRFKMRCIITGATTCPTILLGVLNSATVVGRVAPAYENATANAATQNFVLDAEFTASGLTPGATNFDAAYAVQVVVASTNIKYGGPNTNGGANAWGGFLFEAWDPRPLTTALDGGVNVKQLLGTAWLTPAVAGTPDVNAKQHGGTAQTGRDIGASVLLSTGTGTGQLDFTSGVVKANLAQILGTAITETAGQIAAAFKQFFDVASPTGTMKAITAVGTLTTYTGNTPQTGDAYARLGAPAGASVSADVAAAKADTAAIKLKTDNLPAAPASTTNITAGTITTVTTLTNLPAITSNWLTAAGIAASALNGKGDWNIGKTGYALSAAGVQAIWDALTSALTTVGSIGKKLADWTVGTIDTYTGNTKQTGDAYARLGAPAGASVSADIAAAKADTAAIKLKTDNLPAAPAATGDCITASGVRSAVGLGSANLDTQLDALPTNAELTTALGTADDAVLAAIAALNNLSQANIRTAVGLATANLDTQLDALPTNAELATALGTADDATLAAIAALNNLSSAQVQTAAEAALAVYDPPTRAESTADKDEVIVQINANETKIDTLDTVADAIKAKTDSLTFTIAGNVDANIQRVNDVVITGDGETGTEFGPA